MRFCIPMKPGSEGGRHTFLNYFIAYLVKCGIPIVENTDDDYDVLFVNSWVVPYKVVRRAKRKRERLIVVHRVDGCAEDYGRLDGADRCQARVNTLADLTIFQSEYSRFATREKFRVIQQDGPVIFNPVDTTAFHPEGARLELPGRTKLGYVTYSTNARKGAPLLYDIARGNPDIDFMLIGRYQDPPSIANLHRLGVLDRITLPQALRACDAFLCFAENESCPNSVLEAMACGLPVAYRNSGALHEIVGPAGVAVEKNGFRDQLFGVLEKRSELSAIARERSEKLFAPDVIFPRYFAAIQGASRRPIPSFRRLASLSLQGYPVLGLPVKPAAYRLRERARKILVRKRG